MLGKLGASWFVPPLKMLIDQNDGEVRDTARPTHRHRLLGKVPSGKSSATMMSMHRLRKDIQPPSHAGHSTQLVGAAPLSSPLMATKVVTSLIAAPPPRRAVAIRSRVRDVD